jgi:hypothetical protein
VVRLINDGKFFHKIEDALVVSATAEGDVETESVKVSPIYPLLNIADKHAYYPQLHIHRTAQ